MRARELELLRRWSVRADPEDRGLAEGWFRERPRDGWVAARTDEPWQKALGGAHHGVAWYHRRARLPARWLEHGGCVRMRFGAAATDCRVWVNGVEVGRHVGDYLPFDLDITEALGGRERCEIVCRVDEIKGSPPKVVGKEPWIGHITKGFHDVVSLQHGGIWGGVAVRETGPLAIAPNGLAVRADPSTGEVLVQIELHDHDSSGSAEVVLVEPGTGAQQRARTAIGSGQARAEVRFNCPTIHRWSPDDPTLGAVHVAVRANAGVARDEATARFAFRTFAVGGEGNRRILLNGTPLLLRGMLDWGVEHEHIAPSPTREELLVRFRELRARGFNCVCLCMVYPPEHFYDVADETGMLLWQIHPVWKSSMAPEHMAEYRRLFEAFFRRDRNHPSVFLVSATCEHECFDLELGRWWWGRGREELPNNLLQVQTGFLQWSDTDRMDLWDEHTYDNSGRWVCYMDDLARFFEANPPRPFVMGETIIGTSWPDTAALLERLGEERPWWAPKGLDGFAEFERAMAERFGACALERLRAHGEAFNLAQRKLQGEILRSRPYNAGWVMNHQRDVSSCQCGFQDDLDRWRFSPAQLRPFLADRTLLLRPPAWAAGMATGEPVSIDLGVSNFASGAFDGVVRLGGLLESDGVVQELPTVEHLLRADSGEVAFVPVEIEPHPSDRPSLYRLRAEAAGAESNEWRLWAFPAPTPLPEGVYRDTFAPFSDAEHEPEFEEKRYSSGWALECASWRPRLPDLTALLPGGPVWQNEELPPRVDHLTIVAPRLTEHMLLHLERGGRVVLLASKAAGSPPTKWVNLYGQVPQIIESGDGGRESVLGPGDSAWVLDTLGLDLNRGTCRAVPTFELGLADAVDPVIRLVFTHDKGAPEPWDQLFMSRVGAGLLVVSTLDHDSPAGRYLLARVVEFAHRPDAPRCVRSELPLELVRGWRAPA